MVAGNSYVTGFFAGSATFGAGETNETILTSAGNRDIFVAKYDASGDLVWAKRAGGTIADFASGIAVNGSGNSYVSGQFAGSATFGVGETSETTLTTAGGRDIFVAKYDASGDLVWAKRAGGTGADSASGIAVDGADNSYVTGDFAGSATFGAGETNETTLPSAGAPDIFVAKFGLGVPTLTSLSMPIALLGGAGFTLTLNGVDFVAGSVVEFDMVARATTFLDTMTLTVPVTMGDLATIQTFSVQVVNPGPGGTSLALPLAVENPAPTLALLDPPIASVGDAAFTLTVNGNNFVSSSVVEFNGGARATTFVDPFTLTVPVTMGDLATIQTFSVQVVNPGPGGGTSLPLPLAVENPAPTLTSLSMPIALLGGAGFTLTLNGVDFVSGSVVQFDGAPRASTFVDSATLTVPVTMGDLATIQTFSVQVVNPGPGGGTSLPLPLAVENPAPTLTSLSMPIALLGGPAFTLTLSGVDFVSSSVVQFDGVPRATTFLDTMTLTVPVTMPDLATIQTFLVRVVTSGPGGGPSGALPLAVENPAPTLTSLSMPVALFGGAGFTLTLNGADFVPGSVVEFDGVPRVTTFLDTMTLTVPVTMPDLATIQTFSVRVVTPGPGGGTSGALPLAVENPAPTLTSLSMPIALLGGAAFTLTVNGAGFVPGSLVHFDMIARATTFVDPMTLTVPVTMGDLATIQTFSVTVFTAGPGGGTSSALPLAVQNPAPVLTSLSVDTATVGDAPFTLTLSGMDFVPGAIVGVEILFAGVLPELRMATFVDSTSLTVSITAADLATAGGLSLTVANPAPGGGVSAPLLFTVINQVATLTSLEPELAIAGAPPFTLHVNGMLFVLGAAILLDGAPLVTTFLSPTSLRGVVPASLFAAPGQITVTVQNPGVGPSNALNLMVNPQPLITSLAPTVGLAGNPLDLFVTVHGDSFARDMEVFVSGQRVPTTFNSAQRLGIRIPPGLLAAIGFLSVEVRSAGGAQSNLFNLGVVGPLVSSVRIEFPNAPIGPAQGVATAIIDGTGFPSFVADVAVTVNGNNAPVMSSSFTQIIASVTLADALPGALVVVTNFGTFGSVPIMAQVETPLLTLAELTPPAVTQGAQGVQLVISGNGFDPGTSVDFGGTILAPSSNTGTALTVTVPQALLGAAGLVPVAVINSQNLRSADLTFTINPPLTVNPELPTGQAGELYMAAIEVSGGTGAYAYLATTALPAGLELDSGTGVLSGRLTDQGRFLFGVAVSDEGGAFVAQPFSLLIEGRLITPSRLAFELGSTSTFDEQSFTLQAEGQSRVGFLVQSNSEFLAVKAGDESGELTPGTPQAVVVRASRGGRGPGVYDGELVVTETTVVGVSQNDAARSLVSVKMTVNPSSPVMRPTQTGLTFIGAVDGPPPTRQTFGIGNQGDGLLDWEIAVNTQGTGNWLQVSPRSGTSRANAETPVVRVTVDPSRVALAPGLAPSTLYAQLTIRSAQAMNSPERLTVVFDLSGADGAPVPTVDPQGLVFRTDAQGQAPARTLRVANSSNSVVNFTAALGQTTSAAGGEVESQVFIIDTVAGSVGGPAGGAVDVTVRADAGGLAPGVYRNTLAFELSDVSGPLPSQQVSLLALVTANVAAPLVAKQQAGCEPSSVALAFQAPGEGNPVKFGFPAAVRLEASDDCGRPLVGGSISVAFSNGDPLLFLHSLRNGVWEGTWSQTNSVEQGVSLTAFANREVRPGLRIEGKAQVNVNVAENSAAPPVILAFTNSADFREASIAPGMLTSIFGQNLSLESESAASFPLPEALGGTSIQIGDGFGGMIFVSPNQENVQSPFESTANTLGPITIFRSDLAISNRVEIEVESSQPSIFVAGGSLLPIVTDTNFQLVTPLRPVRTGDALIAFMSGLGVVEPFVGTGAASPTPPAVVDGVTMIINEIVVTPLFAGLTPGFAGLYQLNFVVPEGVDGPGEPHLTIRVEVDGESSPEFRIPLVRP